MILKGHVNKVFFLILGSVLTLLTTIISKNHTFKEDNKTRFLAYKVDSENNLLGLEKLEGLKSKAVFTIDKDTVSRISSVSLDIYNFSGKSFENIPVYIELERQPERGFDKIEILSSSIHDGNGLPDKIKNIQVNPSLKDNIHKVGYEIKTVNSSYDNKFKPVFSARFYIKGFAPKLRVFIDKKSVEIKELNLNDVNINAWYETEAFFTIIFLIALFFFMFSLAPRLARFQGKGFKKNRNRRINEINKRKNIYQNFINREDFANRITEDYDYVSKVLEWEKMPNFIRYLGGYKEPKDPNKDLNF